MSDTNQDNTLKPENGHGAADEFPGEDFPSQAGDEDDDAAPPSGTESSPPEPNDDEVPDGTVLEPGAYLLEVATAIPCRQDVLLAGFAKLGFLNMRVDQSRARSAAQFPVREHRLLANLTKRIAIRQGGAVCWRFVDSLDTDVPSDMRGFRHKLEAFPLERGTVYEALFLSRERSQPTRAIVEEHLGDMGFLVQALTCVKRDLRLPGREGVSVALWFAILEWDTSSSVVTEDDPFYFETLRTRR